jgi:hypothetical protein
MSPMTPSSRTRPTSAAAFTNAWTGERVAAGGVLVVRVIEEEA